MPVAEATIDIAAPASLVWSVMLDFPAYAAWNPFIVRYDGPPRLSVGARFRIEVEWTNKKRASSGEVVTRLEPYTLAYRYTDALSRVGAVRAERVQTLEDLGGRTRYTSREQFSGFLTAFLPLAEVQKGFERHAAALKARAEGLHDTNVSAGAAKPG